MKTTKKKRKPRAKHMQVGTRLPGGGYLMDSDEIKARLLSYRKGPRSRSDSEFGMKIILHHAHIDWRDWKRFVEGVEPLVEPERVRLSRSLWMVETGQLRKENGIMFVGPATKTMRPLGRITVGAQGVSLSNPKAPTSAGAQSSLPSFAHVFGGGPARMPVLDKLGRG